MKRVAITGANGTIGTVLRRGLVGYDITPIDLSETDVRDYERLLEVFPEHDVVVHLAWNGKTENFRSGNIDPNNNLMTFNVYRAAIETKVPRVVMASSIHADSFYKWSGPELLTPDTLIGPDSPYGASKVFMEALGRYHAQQGLEVVCIRFGGVNPRDTLEVEEEGYNKVWLSHGDCVALVRTCIDTPKIPNNFLIIYGVSNNSQRVHDYSNPLGWLPKDDANGMK
ncbi:MAG: NAD(P)-dependent oxidoreductase [Candidatus Aenigmarchaeota archaeon]|nr:NAD(P)-dependent oxidoreductase [Candidatus Aenigmarchaeota archaeon]